MEFLFAHFISGLLIYFLFISFFTFLQKKNKDNRLPNESQEPIVVKKEIPVEFVKDNVCNTILQKDKAYIVRINGQDEYFCSWQCRQKYIASKV
ncbi:MAG: transcriptional regulator [Bacillota bacterium]